MYREWSFPDHKATNIERNLNFIKNSPHVIQHNYFCEFLLVEAPV